MLVKGGPGSYNRDITVMCWLPPGGMHTFCYYCCHASNVYVPVVVAEMYLGRVFCVLFLHPATFIHDFALASDLTLSSQFYGIYPVIRILWCCVPIHSQTTPSAPVILYGTSELGWAILTCGCWQINSILANIGHRNSIGILNQYPFWWNILIQS